MLSPRRLPPIFALAALALFPQSTMAVTIDFQWKDYATEETLVARDSYSGHGLFVPSPPTGERVELGRISVVQQLARDIVAEMRAPW